MHIPNPRFSRRGFVALSIAGILLPTLFLGMLGLHMLQRHLRFQDEILEEYGRFSVEYAASEIQRAVDAQEHDIVSRMQLLALGQVDPIAPLSQITATDPLVQSVFVWPKDGSIAFAAPASSDSWQVSAANTIRRRLDPFTIQDIFRAGTAHEFTGIDADAVYQFVVFPYRSGTSPSGGIMGFFLDVGQLRDVVVGQVLETSIHTAAGRFAPDFGKTLTLVVRDQVDQPIYTHHQAGYKPKEAGNAQSTRDLARAGLDRLLPGWTVGITYTDPSGFDWMRSFLTLEATLLALAAVLAVTGTLVAMRFGLRQMELARMKSHLVSNITHEIKTPLAAIRLYTETLQQGRVRDRTESDRFFEIIHNETDRLAALLDRVLDFSRMESGRWKHTFAPGNVGDIVGEVVGAYAYQVRAQGFELRLNVEPVPLALVDRDALGQAVLNLLDNAVKYSHESKEVTVTVRVGEKDVGGPEVLVEVRDRGIGIAAAEQQRIFEAFYRVEKGLEHDVKGSGLGLALVKHVVEAHGGRVELESRPGVGSTFRLCLPTCQVERAIGDNGLQAIGESAA